jgi:PBP1b-binding outer membrane lipoprotein LpoB
MQNPFTIRSQHLTIACLALLLGGCASEPVPEAEPILSGEKMLSESQDIANLGDRWKKGKQMIDRGNILVREGQNKIDEGNRMIEEGQRVQRESEEGYKTIKK